MPFTFTKYTLQVLRKQALNAPDKLTPTELAIARKILHCTLCGNLWMRRKKVQPTNCPACHKAAWDRPLIQAILDAEDHGSHQGGTHE